MINPIEKLSTLEDEVLTCIETTPSGGIDMGTQDGRSLWLGPQDVTWPVTITNIKGDWEHILGKRIIITTTWYDYTDGDIYQYLNVVTTDGTGVLVKWDYEDGIELWNSIWENS